MRFRFCPEESRLYDFLNFPSLAFFREGYKKSDAEHNYKDLLIDNYLTFVKKIEYKLTPYIKDIEMFYSKHFLSEYDFIDLISKACSIFDYKSEKEYLDMLLKLNENEINKNIIYSLMLIEENHYGYSEEIIKLAEDISRDKDKLISYIKDLPLEASQKWSLFLITEKPLEHMKKYVELMNNLLPIFEEVYLPYEDEVKTYGQNLVNFLNKNGSKGLEEITYSILNTEIIGEKDANILISALFLYAISIINTRKGIYIGWGLKMEEAFKTMKEINENKTIERVQIFKNLGDKTRYEVLKLIASGETSTKEIAKALGVSSATVSYHISNFLTSKVLKMDRTDNKYGYVVDYELLKETIKAFKEDLKFPE